nr:tetratricopeptide repeat protein [Kiritimatiellia bacterium]
TLGSSLYELKNYDESVRHLEDLLISYPNSGLFYTAKMTLGRAFRDAGRFEDAVAALGDVFRYAENPVIREEANQILARIHVQQAAAAREAGKTEEAGQFLRQAAAAFKRTIELADRKQPELVPFRESAGFEVIDVYAQMERIPDAIKLCDEYLSMFASGDRVEAVRQKRFELRQRLPAETAPAADGAGGRSTGS